MSLLSAPLWVLQHQNWRVPKQCSHSTCCGGVEMMRWMMSLKKNNLCLLTAGLLGGQSRSLDFLQTCTCLDTWGKYLLKKDTTGEQCKRFLNYKLVLRKWNLRDKPYEELKGEPGHVDGLSQRKERVLRRHPGLIHHLRDHFDGEDTEQYFRGQAFSISARLMTHGPGIRPRLERVPMKLWFTFAWGCPTHLLILEAHIVHGKRWNDVHVLSLVRRNVFVLSANVHWPGWSGMKV